MLQFNQTEPSLNRVVIMGCNALSISTATSLAEKGHAIHIMDVTSERFNELPTDHVENGRIVPVIGDCTVQQDQLRAAVPDSDVFLALSNEDTANALAAQMSKVLHEVQIVICRMDNTTMVDIYNNLGIIAINTTSLISKKILTTIGS